MSAKQTYTNIIDTAADSVSNRPNHLALILAKVKSFYHIEAPIFYIY